MNTPDETIAMLKACFMKFGVHDNLCAILDSDGHDGTFSCDCGYDEAITKIEALTIEVSGRRLLQSA